MWSLDGVLIRPNLYSFPAMNIVLIEHVLGAVLLSPFLILGWKKIKILSKKSMFDILWVSLFGGLLWAYMIAFGGMGQEFFNTDFFTTPAFYAILAAFAFWSSTVFGSDFYSCIDSCTHILRNIFARKFWIYSVETLLNHSIYQLSCSTFSILFWTQESTGIICDTLWTGLATTEQKKTPA